MIEERSAAGVRLLADAQLDPTPDVEALVRQANDLEACGAGGIWCGESAHDPFLPLTLVAAHTRRATIGTSIAVAFARSPMTTAYAAEDLQRLSGGRFVLGLGSQVRAHIMRRFSMPWGKPAARMREYVEALKAIWAAWRNEEGLNFRGDFYELTLMTPFFSPGPSPLPSPPVYLAAVGPLMTETVGAVADGTLIHPLVTPRYLRERTLPLLERSLGAVGRTRDDLVLRLSGLVATGRDEAELTDAVAAARRRVAFYASTPAYRDVLALHGWEQLGEELHALSRERDPGAAERMASLVDDEVLNAFVVVGEPEQAAAEVLNRFGDLVDRFAFYLPQGGDRELRLRLIELLVAAVR